MSSVRAMTTEQIETDLETVSLMWPDGIPETQNDRVTALKTELKRRLGTSVPREKAAAKPKSIMSTSVEALDTDALGVELRRLAEVISKDDNNEEAKNRFADVRYELRRRARRDEPQAPKPSPQVATPELDLSDVEAPKKRIVPRLADSNEDAKAPNKAVEQFSRDAKMLQDTHVQLQLAAATVKVAVDILTAGGAIVSFEDQLIDIAVEVGAKVAQKAFEKFGLVYVP